jgi:hypothetical protein
MSNQVHPFVMFPTRIWNLPGITLQLLKFYEKIFQFWHQGYECFVSNKTLMEYAGMKSDSTVRDAFTYFEKNSELKRVMRGGKRYIIPPQPRVSTDSVDNSDKSSANDVHTSAVALGGERCGAGGTSAVALPNNINIIKQNNEKLLSNDEQKKHKAVDKTGNAKSAPAVRKEDWKEANQKKHSWASGQKDSPIADVTKQSTSYDPSKYDDTKRFDPNSPGYQAFLDANPAIRRKREKREAASKATELSTGTAVPTEVSSGQHPSKASSEHALDGQSYFAPELRNSHRVMAPSSARSYLEKTGLAGEDTLARA